MHSLCGNCYHPLAALIVNPSLRKEKHYKKAQKRRFLGGEGGSQSVEADGVRGGPATLLLELQQQLISLVLRVLCVLKAPAELRGTCSCPGRPR